MDSELTSPHIQDVGSLEERKLLGFTKRQLTFLFTYGVYNIFRGAVILIAGPFYPPEAEKHGISSGTVGFVFAVFDFATFLSSLFYGKLFIPKMGPHRVIVFSVFNTTLCTALFGCLGFVNDRTTFIVCSFVIRAIAGAGDAGFYPSAFAIFAYEFPELISTTVGLFEFFFGIGAILGPIACGPLIDCVGFEWTYITVGGCLLISAISVLFLTPNSNYRAEEVVQDSNYGIRQLLKLPAMYYGVFSLFSTAVSIGFITGTLEYHLQQFDLSSLQIGSIFSINTGIYMVCSPLWGQLSDRLRFNKVLLISSGAILICVGFTLLGPLDFISHENLLWTTLVGLSLHGIGIGAAIMLFFAYVSESAILHGFPDTTNTFGLISSIFTLTFSLGNSFGPALSGNLYDIIGFEDTTLVVVGLSCFVIISTGLLMAASRGK